MLVDCKYSDVGALLTQVPRFGEALLELVHQGILLASVDVGDDPFSAGFLKHAARKFAVLKVLLTISF